MEKSYSQVVSCDFGWDRRKPVWAAWKVFWGVSTLFLNAALALAGEIRGKVTDPQGGAIANVRITAQLDGSPASSVVTGEDGAYVLESLAPGQYTIRAAKAGYTEASQGPIEIAAGAPPRVVNLRLAPGGEAEAVRGAEERNPNDFVYRLDTNAIVNEMGRVGAAPRFLPEFSAERSMYGEQFGYPLRRVEWATPDRLLRDFHGSLYEFHQNSALNARPFFQVGALKPSRRNQYGFSISGPLVREKASFNFAWGQVRDSGFVNGNVQIPLSGERTPRSSDAETNAIVAALLQAFPSESPNLPHVSLRHLNTNGFRDIRSTAFSAHLDWQPRPEDRLAYDQQFVDSSEQPFELVLGQNPETFLRPQSYRLNYGRSVSPQTVFQVAFNYLRLGAELTPTEQYQNLLAPLGIGIVPDVDFGDEISPIGIPNQGIPRRRFENHFLFSPRWTQTRGSHRLSAGFSAQRFRDNDVRASNARGTFNFGNDFGRTAVENFLQGTATRLQVAVGNQYRGYRYSEFGFYFQDRFSVREGLTLQAGIRYEILTAPREVNGLIPFTVRTDANNVAPQFGFAWNPGGGRTVLRGGYGLSFAPVLIPAISRQGSNPPHVLSLTISTPRINEVANIPFLVPDPNRRANLGVLDPNFVVPYSHLYNFAVERDLPGNVFLRVGYFGSRTFKIFTEAKLNRARPVPGIEPTSRTVNDRRPDPRFQRINAILNNSNAYLDALQVSVAKRRTRGLTLETTYTFSKSLDTSLQFADGPSSGDGSQTEDLMSDMKAVSNFDAPHSLSLVYAYDLPPALGASPWLSRLFSRWRISGTTTFRSGTPFTIFTGSDAPGIGNVDGEPDDRPNLLDPAILGKSVDDPDTAPALMAAETCKEAALPAQPAFIQCRYFDTNLPVGGRGSLGRNTLRKDGVNNWNFALTRSFPVGIAGAEKQLQFRAEFYNFFNHAQFAAPGRTVSSPTFGKITNTVNKGRVTQLTLRFVF